MIHLTPLLIMEIAAVGLLAGVVGGLAGVGGSLVMLPALHWLLGDPRSSTHHLYMATAMCVNIAVALPAAWKHNRSGAVRHDLLKTLMVATIIGVIAGVFIGNRAPGETLRIALGLFILVYCTFNLWRLLACSRELEPERERVGVTNLGISGVCTGLIGGLLGLGGGVLLVPMLQMLCKVRLKQAIATSSAVIWLSAIVGATLKMTTLHTRGERWQDAGTLALVLAPTAILGGVLGAVLTQKLPTQHVRTAVTVLLALVAMKLFNVY